LSVASWRGITVPGQHDAIRLICAWLDRWRTESGQGPAWPYWVSRADLRAGQICRDELPRPSWCYGTAGQARARQLAGIALGDIERQRMAEDALVRALTDPGKLAATTGTALCHGFAGLAHIVARCAADALPPSSRQLQSLIPVLLNAVHPPGADAEETVTTLLADPGYGHGFLDGAAGIALAVLAPATGTQPLSAWDTCLLTT
jgi:lantibiotic biosynthesis protein